MIYELVRCRNPQIIKTLEHVRRSIPKDWLKPVIRKGTQMCAWCVKEPLPPGRRKYCSEECLTSADAYCYPQSSPHAFRILMVRQNYACETCGHSYCPAFNDSFEHRKRQYRRIILESIRRIKIEIPESRRRWQEHKKTGKPNVGFSGRDEYGHWIRRYPLLEDKELDSWECNMRITVQRELGDYLNFRKRGPEWSHSTPDEIRRFHRMLKDNKEPEIDHIIPIFKGGMSIGLDNVQILCYSCHKKKTKKDMEKATKAPAKPARKRA